MAKRYVIFVCDNCGLPLFAKEFQKTRKCPRCYHNIRIERARKIGHADDELKASRIVRFIKLPKDLKAEFKPINPSTLQGGSKRDQFMKIMLSLTKNVEGKAISENELFKISKNHGLDEKWVRNQLARMERNGSIMRPKDGFIVYLSQSV
ncbi:MAG: DUF1922 domain-containing protein [Promethearchaeota archaeon]